jgi:hypothetical protein
MWESRCSRPSRNKDLVQLTKYGVRVYHESHASGVFRDVGERLPGPWLSRLSDSVASKGPARPSAVDSRATLSPDCHGCVTVCVARIGLLTNLRLRQASLAWWQQCLSVCLSVRERSHVSLRQGQEMMRLNAVSARTWTPTSHIDCDIMALPSLSPPRLKAFRKRLI